MSETPISADPFDGGIMNTSSKKVVVGALKQQGFIVQESNTDPIRGELSLREALDEMGIEPISRFDEDIVKLLSQAIELWDGETL